VPDPIAAAAEVIAPARLGRGFRWLLSAAVVTNIGDGVAIAAGPLLVASQSRDPLLVSMAFPPSSSPRSCSASSRAPPPTGWTGVGS
jgi:hypothetical protein